MSDHPQPELSFGHHAMIESLRATKMSELHEGAAVDNTIDPIPLSVNPCSALKTKHLLFQIKEHKEILSRLSDDYNFKRSKAGIKVKMLVNQFLEMDFRNGLNNIWMSSLEDGNDDDRKENKLSTDKINTTRKRHRNKP